MATKGPAARRLPGWWDRILSETDAELSGTDVDLVLAAVPLNIAAARHAVWRLLDRSGVPTEVTEDVLLLVSELVTNAVLHAGTDVRVMADVDPERIRVAVGDEDPLHAPHRPQRGAMATSGRGIALVDMLSTGWGISVASGSKIVWFEMAHRHLPRLGGSA